MATTTSGLTKFSVKFPDPDPAPVLVPPATLEPTTERTSAVVKGKKRGTSSRVGVAVRLGHDDWCRVHELAVRERTSLQALIVGGLDELMKQRGLPPLSGR